jgi:hypothetical protein
MTHYAKVDNGIVTQVIVAEQDFIDSGILGEPTSWLQTSYNTVANVHPEGRPFRKNFAGIGYTYDSVLDAFIPPKPYNSWLLNESSGQWYAPVDYPTDGKPYSWSENTRSWLELTEPPLPE